MKKIVSPITILNLIIVIDTLSILTHGLGQHAPNHQNNQSQGIDNFHNNHRNHNNHIHVKIVSRKEGERGGENANHVFSLLPPSHLDSDSETQIVTIKHKDAKIKNLFKTSILKSTFLPMTKEQKHLATNGYISYVIFNAIQDLSTQMRSVLATQRILEGVGVGKEGATALSASLNFILRDGAGMVASLLFTAMNGSHFGKDIKRWKLFADTIVDLGIFLEVLTISLPKALFLPVLCVANMCKALCGVAAGSCGGAISLYWAEETKTDISDINAKFGAQNTVTGGLGLVFAALFARSVSQVSQFTLWGLFLSLTSIHIFANMKCMRIITFRSLNTVRFNLIAIPFLDLLWNKRKQKEQELTNTLPGSENTDPLDVPSCPTPDFISQKEPLFFFSTRFWKKKDQSSFYPLHLGIPIQELIHLSKCSSVDLNERLREPNFSYIVNAGTFRRRTCIFVALRSNATNLEKGKAYFHALMLSKAMKESKIAGIRLGLMKRWNDGNSSHSEQNVLMEMIEKDVHKNVDFAWERFLESAKLSGWNLDQIDLKTKGFEFDVFEGNDHGD